MAELHLDPVGGVAGDMFAAAMLDLRPDLEGALIECLALCPLIGNVTIEVTRHNDGLFAGRRFEVARRTDPETASDPVEGRTSLEESAQHAHAHAHDDGSRHHAHEHVHEHPPAGLDGQHHDTEHSHVHWRMIRDALVSSTLSQETIEHAVGIFSLLADAEAKVHGIPVEDVCFHEVGAWDSIADIVAAAWLINEIGAARWTVGPVPLGSGRIASAHGLLPVPAPATVLLLEGFVTFDDGIPGERVTPTGAAILRYLCPPPEGRSGLRRLVSSGCGFGTRRLSGTSNILRAILFEEAEDMSFERDEVALLACEIDDQTGEDIAQALQVLRSHPGVLDVVQFPVFGKKGRMMTSLQILAKPGAMNGVLASVFDETTTIGVRHALMSRSKISRTPASVEVDGRRLPAKLARRPSGPTAKLEADSIADVATQAARTALRERANAVLKPGS